MGTDTTLEHRAARLCVLGEGVEIKRYIGDSFHGFYKIGERAGKIGEIITGRMYTVSNEPSKGGRAHIDRRLGGTLTIYGLVSPENGDPRVELTIYRKPGKQ